MLIHMMRKPLATVSFLGSASVAVNISSARREELQSFTAAGWSSNVLINLSVRCYSDSPFAVLISEEFGKVIEGYCE